MGVSGTFVIYVAIGRIPTGISHLPERFEQFTILVLGEMILLVSVGTADTAWGVRSAMTALFGFLVAVLLWWIYFDRVDDHAFDRMLQSIRGPWTPARESLFVSLFGHVFVYLGIVIVGVGLEHAIHAAVPLEPLGGSERFLLCSGVCIFLVGYVACDRVTPESTDQQVLLARALAGALLALIGAGGHSLGPSSVVVPVMLALAALTAFESVYPRLRAGDGYGGALRL